MKTINIFTHLNGVGLQSDYELLKSVLTDYEVRCINLHQRECENSDVGIHLEVPRFEHLQKNKRNIFIPNPEWFYPEWTDKIRLFDEVWCKTYDCFSIFQKHIHSNCKYSGFLSKDLYDESIPKRKVMIHVAGRSETKNTDALCKAYKLHPDLPKCFLVTDKTYPVSNNLTITGRLSEKDFKVLLNACMIHLCPSAYEGFGHYIHEAMGCSNVVLTTDHAPMNEFVTPQDCLIPNDCLIPVKRGKRMRLGLKCEVEPDDLYNSIMTVWGKSDKQLLTLGRYNRFLFEGRVNDFKQFLKDNL